MSIQILSLWFFFLALRKPQKIHPSFCVHMNGKVKQSSEKSKKKSKKEEAFVFINGRRFTSYFGGSYFKVFTSLFSGMIDASTSSCLRQEEEVSLQIQSFSMNLPGKKPRLLLDLFFNSCLFK